MICPRAAARLCRSYCQSRFGALGVGNRCFNTGQDEFHETIESFFDVANSSISDGLDAAPVCRRFISAHDALEGRVRQDWWVHIASEEEQQQLGTLSKVLPGGGVRVAPQLLDSFVATQPGTTERAIRCLVDSLGVSAGLPEVLRLREALRAATASAFRANHRASFALERLDRRIQRLLSLWCSPGLLRVEAFGESNPNHRHHALYHPLLLSNCGQQLRLFRASSALLPRFPNSLQEAVDGIPADGPPRVACFWALEATGAVPSGSLRGLGLGGFLRKRSSALLREELSATATSQSEPVAVGALVSLHRFAAWLRARHAPEAEARRGLPEPFAKALGRAAAGVGAEQRLAFVDADGDEVSFRVSAAAGLSVQLGAAPPSRVLRLRAGGAGGASLLFAMEGTDGPQAMQVNAPEDVVARGDVVRVVQMAESSGILPAELGETLTRLAGEFVRQRVRGSTRVAEPDLHFHLAAGAALRGVHFRADGSEQGMRPGGSLGFMASFVYEPSAEAANASAYATNGIVAEVVTPE